MAVINMTEFALKLTELIFMVANVIVATSRVDIKYNVEINKPNRIIAII